MRSVHFLFPIAVILFASVRASVIVRALRRTPRAATRVSILTSVLIGLVVERFASFLTVARYQGNGGSWRFAELGFEPYRRECRVICVGVQAANRKTHLRRAVILSRAWVALKLGVATAQRSESPRGRVPDVRLVDIRGHDQSLEPNTTARRGVQLGPVVPAVSRGNATLVEAQRDFPRHRS